MYRPVELSEKFEIQNFFVVTTKSTLTDRPKNNLWARKHKVRGIELWTRGCPKLCIQIFRFLTDPFFRLWMFSWIYQSVFVSPSSGQYSLLRNRLLRFVLYKCYSYDDRICKLSYYIKTRPFWNFKTFNEPNFLALIKHNDKVESKSFIIFLPPSILTLHPPLKSMFFPLMLSLFFLSAHSKSVYFSERAAYVFSAHVKVFFRPCKACFFRARGVCFSSPMQSLFFPSM